VIVIQYTLAADSTIQGLGSGKTAAASFEPFHDVSGAGDMVKDMVTDQSDSNAPTVVMSERSGFQLLFGLSSLKIYSKCQSRAP
jgi:hypothetical protein